MAGAPSLQTLCSAQLCSHVVSGGEEVLEQLRPWLAVLPLSTRLSLLVSHRHSHNTCLEPSLLAALSRDSPWFVGGAAFTDEAAACCGGPSLLALDVRRCPQLTARGLLTLLLASPNLTLLRLGGCPASDAAARFAVRALLPRPQRVDDNVPESWELASADFGISACPRLRWLVWPEAGEEARLRIARRCPRVTLVQTPHDSLPLEAQLSRPLDADVVEELRQHISLPAWPQPSRPVPDTTPHIATLFRCAYEERDARLEPKRLRNARKAARLAAEPPQHSVSPAYLRRIGALCHTED